MSKETEPVIVVYTMGKVASTSVSRALKASNMPCYDIHSIAQKRYLTSLRSHMDNPDLVRIPKHLIESLHAMNAIREGRKVKLISLIREPVGRNIAAVFENLPKRLAEEEGAVLKRLQTYHVEVPDVWFREDFIPTLGLKIFAMKHDKTADHFKFQNGNLEALLLKVHVSDERKSELVSAYLGKEIEITRENTAQDKWYSALHAKLANDRRVLSQDFLQRCMSLRYYKAFYSREERLQTAERYNYDGKV